MNSLLSRENVSKCFRFFGNMFMLFIISKVLKIRVDWIFVSISTTVFALWLCLRSINTITREIDTKNIKAINYRVEEAVSFMLLSTLVYHFTILLMFISFVRSPDTKFIVYKICYPTVFELIPLFASCIAIFLRWKDNLKPIYLQISNYIFLGTLVSLTAWVVYTFNLLWGNELALKFTKDYSSTIICKLCSSLILIFGFLLVVQVPRQEYQAIYDTKTLALSNQKNNHQNTNRTSHSNVKKETSETTLANEDKLKKDL